MADDTNQEIGYATSIDDYLVLVNGLPNVAINELVTTKNNARGLTIGVQNDLTEVLMLDEGSVKPKEIFQRTNQPYSISAGEFLLGRTVNALGVPVDGKGRFSSKGESISIAQLVPPIKERELIKEPFETGVTAVDMLIPIAKGQKELIMGDARSGKTGFLIDTIINQRGKNIICIYAMIGKPVRETRQLVDILTINHALDYTCIIAAPSSEIAPLIYLAPNVAVTLAEYFQKKGKDVLLILDDLGTHAKFYREISLLGNRSPGRESYPGDIFYTHAHLMERAGKFNASGGNGSITLLPVIEVNLDDYTAFIPTNLMSMTDGHLLFNSKFSHQGQRPAIDISLSVSRVGRQSQGVAQKLLADHVRSILAEAKKVETLSRFGSEVSIDTQVLLRQYDQIKVVLNQKALAYVPIIVQMIMLGLTFSSLFKTKDARFVTINKDAILKYLSQLDLKTLSSQVDKFTNEEQFIKMVEGLVPGLAKICQTPNK
jgi:F-type H+/Na+-transporting ATPase subunit alpha